jgi:hypothetical protein
MQGSAEGLVMSAALFWVVTHRVGNNPEETNQPTTCYGLIVSHSSGCNYIQYPIMKFIDQNRDKLTHSSFPFLKKFYILKQILSSYKIISQRLPFLHLCVARLPDTSYHFSAGLDLHINSCAVRWPLICEPITVERHGIQNKQWYTGNELNVYNLYNNRNIV